MNQFPSKNYFTLPNEIFSLGLGAGEIAVYAYLRCLENPSTYQCWPSYATIGKAIGRTKNTVTQYVDALSEKGLISTEPTSVLTKSRIKKNGNLCYTIRPIHEAVEIFHTRQLSAVERTTERRQIHRKLSAVNLLPVREERKDRMKHSIYTSYDELPLMLSVPEVAAVLGISRAGAYELVHGNEFPALKIGSRIVVPKDKFLAWIDANSGSKNAPL